MRCARGDRPSGCSLFNVDCFKYRNKIGLDVALAALREYRRARPSRNPLDWYLRGHGEPRRRPRAHAQDMPETNLHGLISRDQEVLASRKVRYMGDPVAVVVARTERAAS